MIISPKIQSKGPIRRSILVLYDNVDGQFCPPQWFYFYLFQTTFCMRFLLSLIYRFKLEVELYKINQWTADKASFFTGKTILKRYIFLCNGLLFFCNLIVTVIVILCVDILLKNGINISRISCSKTLSHVNNHSCRLQNTCFVFPKFPMEIIC